MDTRKQVRQFIETNYYLSPTQKLDDRDSLLDSGIVDSTGIMELVMFIETTLGVKVADAEVLPENLDSIARIADFVERKRKTG
jgi:acyl carrier protein